MLSRTFHFAVAPLKQISFIIHLMTSFDASRWVILELITLQKKKINFSALF